MSKLRSVIEISNRFLSGLKKNKRYRAPVSMSQVKVNLGCGLAVQPGWINIDGSFNALLASLPGFLIPIAYRISGANRYYSLVEYSKLIEENTFIHFDLSKGIPLDNGCADFIYSSHFLEHLYYEDAKFLLSECKRVLKEDGVVRISIPDLEHAVKRYLNGEKHQTLQDYFFVEDRSNELSRHKYMYDFDMLRVLFRESGFDLVKRQSFREGEVPDIECLDNREDESLFVEAKKVNAPTQQA